MQLGVELLKNPIYADCALPPEHVFGKLQPRKNCPSLIQHGTRIYDQCLAAWLLNFERGMLYKTVERRSFRPAPLDK